MTDVRFMHDLADGSNVDVEFSIPSAIHPENSISRDV